MSDAGGRGDGGTGGDPPEDALPQEVVATIKRLLAERGMSQETLAERLGRTETSVSRWLNRRQSMPMGQLRAIAEVLDVPLPELFTGFLVRAEREEDDLRRDVAWTRAKLEVMDRTMEALRQSVRAVPLYRTGTQGDPRRGEGDDQGARATSFAHRPPGLEQTVGGRGFAVVVEGADLAGRGLRPGDVVFCNPDAPWGDGSLVAVGLGTGRADEEAGARPLALRALAYGTTRSLDARTAPEGAPPETHPAGAYVVYGPLVVALCVALLPEGRGHTEDMRRRGPGPTREGEGGTPIVYSGENGNPVTVRR